MCSIGNWLLRRLRRAAAGAVAGNEARTPAAPIAPAPLRASLRVSLRAPTIRVPPTLEFEVGPAGADISLVFQGVNHRRCAGNGSTATSRGHPRTHELSGGNAE